MLDFSMLSRAASFSAKPCCYWAPGCGAGQEKLGSIIGDHQSVVFHIGFPDAGQGSVCLEVLGTTTGSFMAQD